MNLKIKNLFKKDYPFIISEIGINHNGNKQEAVKLIKYTKAIGADAVKFQIRDLNKIYNKKINFKENNLEGPHQYIYNELKKSHLDFKDYKYLFKFSREIGLKVIITPFDENSAKLGYLDTVDAIKIGSPDMESLLLIRKIIKTNKPLIISTGMSYQNDIVKLNSYLKKQKKEYALLHCCSSYPPSNKEIGISFINTLKKISKYVGYSGHEKDSGPSLISIFFGAQIIERHLTSNKNAEGPDHNSSLEPNEFKNLVLKSRKVFNYVKRNNPNLQQFLHKFNLNNFKECIGNGDKNISQNALYNKRILGKSLVYNKGLKKNQVLKEKYLIEKSPGYGITSLNLEKFINKKLATNVKKNQYLSENDFKPKNKRIKNIPMKWGMIGRLGDFENYLEDKPDLVEIHLTWRELINPKKINKNFKQELVVHAPEYYKDKLVDFTSEDKDIISASLEMLDNVVHLTKKISNNFIVKNNDGPRIVLHPGGHTFESKYNFNKRRKYSNLIKNLNKVNFNGIQLLLENIPPYPWYFGGEYKQLIFKDHDEIYNFCSDNNFKICYDVSHAQLYCNDKKISLNKFTKRVKPITSYLHLSDASGINGEGVQIGNGNVNFEKIFQTFYSLNPGFVPEIWQGHLRGGQGFKIAMERLNRIIKKISTEKKCHH